jgi:hypothetical protein
VGGPVDDSVSNRFRAERSGSLTALRTWFKNMGDVRVGYGAGNGGIMSITVETDNAGAPSGTVLGRAVHRPGAADANGINPGRFTLVPFDAPVPVNAGQIYHIVYRNTDPNPQANYSSINGTYQFGPNLPNPVQPKWADNSLASLRKSGSGRWEVFAGTTPILDLTYADGTHQGQGYSEPELNTPVISGTTMLRERFTVTGGNRIVTGASVRLAKTSGTGNLLVLLEHSSGALIDSFTIPTTNLPTLNRTATASAGIWVSGSFASPRTLTTGETYHLRLSTDPSTILWTRGIQSGDMYGFHPATHFADGYLQTTTNAGASWNYVTGLDKYGDLPFTLQQTA